MNSNNRNKAIPFLRYFPGSVKFYDLKNEKIAALVFIVLLTINFCSNLLAANLSKNLVILNTSELVPQNLAVALELLLRAAVVSLISSLLMNIFSSYYIYAYLRDLRGIPYTLTECIKDVSKKLFRIIVLTLIISVAIFTGTMLFAIPGLIIYIMFIFANQYLVDQNRSVFNSLKGSVNLTNGYKMGIFMSVLMLDLIILIFPSFAESSNGILVFAFVSAFIATIFNIIYQRFITLIYFDLEYVRKQNNIDQSPI